MTITNEPTTTPEVPAWLNLDGYCPPEIRVQLNDAAEAIVDFIEDGRFERLCRQVWEAHVAYARATHHNGDDFEDVQDRLNDLTGFEAMHAGASILHSLSAIASGEQAFAPIPAWYRSWDDTMNDLREVQA